MKCYVPVICRCSWNTANKQNASQIIKNVQLNAWLKYIGDVYVLISEELLDEMTKVYHIYIESLTKRLLKLLLYVRRHWLSTTQCNKIT